MFFENGLVWVFFIDFVEWSIFYFCEKNLQVSGGGLLGCFLGFLIIISYF